MIIPPQGCAGNSGYRLVRKDNRPPPKDSQLESGSSGLLLSRVIRREQSRAPAPRDRMESRGGTHRASALPLPLSSCVDRQPNPSLFLRTSIAITNSALRNARRKTGHKSQVT